VSYDRAAGRQRWSAFTRITAARIRWLGYRDGIGGAAKAVVTE
jgi:hypothetical protein